MKTTVGHKPKSDDRYVTRVTIVYMDHANKQARHEYKTPAIFGDGLGEHLISVMKAGLVIRTGTGRSIGFAIPPGRIMSITTEKATEIVRTKRRRGDGGIGL